MKHKMGNTPKCFECKYYVEHCDKAVKLNPWMTGWCIEPWNLSHGINGHVCEKKDRIQTRNTFSCHRWVDAESGHTYYEVNTGISETTGEKINFEGL